MRDLKTLYGILLIKFTDGTAKSRYLCSNIKWLCNVNIITKEEKSLLMKHFQSQKPRPRLHRDFYDNELYNKHSKFGDAWFHSIIFEYRGREIRIEFLKRIISTI